ncbi:hypothetical protein AWF07_01810 [Escherichia coli]|nr:hypothetical protein AWF07_01810 [Escherichia coli]
MSYQPQTLLRKNSLTITLLICQISRTRAHNRKPISNGAFYRLIEQAKERGLIKVDQEITHKKDENGNQIGKGKKGDKLITLLPNWEYNLGDK